MSKPTKKQIYACTSIWYEIHGCFFPNLEFMEWYNSLSKESASKYISENIGIYNEIKRRKRKVTHRVSHSRGYAGEEDDLHNSCLFSVWYE